MLITPVAPKVIIKMPVLQSREVLGGKREYLSESLYWKFGGEKSEVGRLNGETRRKGVLLDLLGLI